MHAPAVAAPVRARSTGFKPKDRVHTSNSGAQWTARPTDSLRLWADWRAAILAAVPSMWVERGRGFFRPGWSPAVAALVRARKTRFKSRSRVCVTKPPTPARNGSARLYQLPTPRVSGVISVTRKPTCPWWVVPGAGTSFSVTAR